jgi:thioredoxin 1
MGNKTLFIGIIVALLAVTGPAGAAQPDAPKSTPELTQAIGAGKKTVVFFLNPQGGPCRAQNEIVQKLQKDRKMSFNVAYVSTMNPGDQKAFYEYGVRNLPQLVLVDSKGKIAQFFPPGIQSYQALSTVLDGTK